MANIHLEDLRPLIEDQMALLPPDAKVSLTFDFGDIMYLKYDVKMETRAVPDFIDDVAKRVFIPSPKIRAWFHPMTLQLQAAGRGITRWRALLPEIKSRRKR